jgi:hypothetical protein
MPRLSRAIVLVSVGSNKSCAAEGETSALIMSDSALRWLPGLTLRRYSPRDGNHQYDITRERTAELAQSDYEEGVY